MAETPGVSRPISDRDRKDVVDVITGGMADLVGGRPGLFNDRPGFVAGGGPDSPLPNLVRAMTQYKCRFWAAANKSNYSARVNAGNAEICGPYLDGLGENPSDGSLAPPFPGGQCAVPYLVYATNGGVDLSIGGQTPLNIDGPLSAPAFTQTVVGTPFPDSTRYQWIFPSEPTAVLQFTARASFTPNPGYRVAGRVDAAPDNCGNAPAVDIEPPATVTPSTPIPPNITVNVPGFGPVTVTVDADDDGDTIFCVDEIDSCFTVNVGDEGGGPGDNPPPPPGDVGSPGSTEATGVGGEADGEAPEGEVLVGLLLDLVAAPPNAKQFRSGVYRAGAYVYMGTPAGLDMDYAGSMLRDGQFVYAEKDNLTKWSVTANSGYNWNVIPYYREAG